MKKLIYQTLNKKYLIILIILLLFIILLFIPQYSHAFLGKIADLTVGSAFNGITQLFKDLLSWVLDNLVKPLLINVMSYTNFFSNGVNAGWTVVRDFANLFFALILLIIAIATVLNGGPLDNYTAKRMLPSFIFVALFINFSKAIVGFFIDISQIIMITFYNAFGPNLMDSITRASKLAESVSKSQTDQGYINLLIIITILILIVTLLWTVIILAIRIVYLWVIIMISPIAFLSLLVPALKSIADDWKNKFQEALVVGPTIMFLLYLAVSVMNNGISGNQQTTGGSNLFDNGNFIDFVFVIILFFLANSIAMKAGQSAPPMLQKAVGIGTTLATLGTAKYVGAGGYGTGQMLKTGKEYIKGGLKNVDKVKGGATRAVQVVSGGKYNLNDRYEMRKQQRRERVEKGKAVENIPFIGSRIKDSRTGKWISSVAQQTAGGEAGRKANFNRTQLKMAEEARLNGTLDNDPALQKALAAEEARILENYKGEEDADTIIKEIEKAVNKGDLITARALRTHLNSLGEINKLMNQNSPFAQIAKQYATEADQLAAFDRDVLKIGGSKYDKSYQVRNRNIAKSKKGMEGFGATPSSTLTIGAVNNPTTSDLFQDYKNGSISENAKKFSDNLFSRRKKNLATNEFTFDGNGNSEYEFDINAFDDFVSSRSMNELENPDTWKSMNQSLKTVIINGLRNSGLQKNDPGNTAAAWRGIEP